MREMLGQAGFKEREWRDVSDKSLEWFRSEIESRASAPEDAPPPLGLNLIMGPSFAEKLGNVFRNLKEDRIRVVMGVFEK